MKVEKELTNFDDMGFLASRIERGVATVREKLGEWRRLYFDLNQFAQSLFYTLKVNNRNAQQLIVYSAFYRSLTAYQVVFLLVERGNDIETKIILRSATEAALLAMAVAKSKEFVVKFIKADEDTRRKLLKKTLAVTGELTAAGHKLYLTPLQLEEMEKELKDLEGKKATGELVLEIRREEIARVAELLPLYLQHFAYFSLYTHLTPSGMRDLLVRNEKGEITDFRTGVSDDDALSNLRVAIVLLITTLEAVNRLISCNIKDEIDNFKKRLVAIVSEFEKNPSPLASLSQKGT